MIVDLTDLDRERAIDQIEALERRLFGRGAWSRNAISEELDAPARAYWADVEPDGGAGTPVIRGYAGTWFDGYDEQIMTIGVDPEHQRHGIGNALLERIIDHARADGAERILLEVRVDNEPAIALYRAHGFTRMGIRRRYYQPEGVDAYTMSLELKPRIVGFQPAHQ